MSEHTKEAIKIVLELYKENKLTNEQVLALFEALTENTPTFSMFLGGQKSLIQYLIKRTLG